MSEIIQCPYCEGSGYIEVVSVETEDEQEETL
jgi:hypothetical protein